jgi:peptidoglycan/LPS O-acetylase OafA/YrhL
MLRGVAAVLVMLSHLRAFVFYPYNRLASPGPVDAAVWMVTSLGHQAVMVFFVLSGFFIARSVIADDRRKELSWGAYLIKRLTRLWVVLIPCLALTFFLDRLGMLWFDSKFYNGSLFEQYNSGPSLATGGADLTLFTFVANIFFLQTIAAPTFGSNGPLWSLANELWYYVMFFLVYIFVSGAVSILAATFTLCLFISICIFVGEPMRILGLIWLAGALSYVAYDKDWFAMVRRSRILLGAAVVAVSAAVAASETRYSSNFVRELAVGLSTAVLIPVLANYKNETSKIYRYLARKLADASYTIYLAHFPFLALLSSAVLGNHQLPNSGEGYATFIGFGIITLLYCYVVYSIFERHTETIRRYFLSKYSQAAPNAFNARLRI